MPIDSESQNLDTFKKAANVDLTAFAAFFGGTLFYVRKNGYKLFFNTPQNMKLSWYCRGEEHLYY